MLVRALTAILLAGALSGCQELERADECRQIARVTNPVLAQIDHDRKSVKPASYRAIATKYEALANEAGKVKIRTKKIAAALDDYRRVLHEAARDARTYAEALEKNDNTRIIVAHSSAAHTLRHETAAIARLDIACRLGR